MKSRNLIRLIAASSFMALSGSAMASDGTITFTGSLTDTTCTISLNGGGPSGTVTLPTVSASLLAAAGNTAGPTPFAITLTGCSGGTLNTASAWFENTGTVDTATGRLNNASGAGQATGVQIELTNTSGVSIVAGGTTATMGGPSANISSGNGTLNYLARYYASSSPVTSGQVNTQVTYSIVYQ